MADVQLFDTAQEVVPFEPGHEVKMYVCGITPYDSTHLVRTPISPTTS